MNLILLFDQDFIDPHTARLEGRRARHIEQVQRVEPGDQLMVGRLNGSMGYATVVSCCTQEVVLKLSVRLDQTNSADQPQALSPPPASGIDLLLAMPRPKILRKVLQSAAALGVKRLVLIASFRVEKSYFDSPLLAPEALSEQLVLGLEQARDTVLPQIFIRRRFKPFVEDEVQSFWPTGPRLLAHPVANVGIEDCDVGKPHEPAVVAIGPEGGWIPYEVELLEAHRFKRFGLGPRILRVDTVVPYVHAQMEVARRKD